MPERTGTRTALLIVDMQNGVVAEAWERDRVVANIALAVDQARACQVPVLWVQHEDEELVRGTPAWQWVAELEPRTGETAIHKRYNSAFEDTPLAAELDRLGVGHIVLAGAATNWCIRATAYAALERGFDLTLIGDGHTTVDMHPGPDSRIPAATVIADLNAVMQWISYPGRKSAVVNAEDLAFSAARASAPPPPLP